MDFVQPLQSAFTTFINYVPQIVGALVILVIVAKVLQAVVGRLLQSIGFDGWMERGGIKQFFDRAQTRQTPASILGKLIFWGVFVIVKAMTKTPWASARSRRSWPSLSLTSPASSPPS